MKFSRTVIALALVLATATARADDALTTYEDLHRTDVELQRALMGGGAVSIVHGAVLCGFSRYDNALQVAGGVTLAFGAANLFAGIAGEVALRKEARRVRAWGVPDAMRLDVLELAEKKTVTYAVNLGLDAGYAFAGATAVIASQANIGHHDRWLGAGVAILAQGVFAAGIDAIGMTASRRAARRLR